jgi:F-type H+-transporting ATPase subunit gamma
MEDLERAETRLDNIRTVEPILSALRTVSLGSWQAALKRKDSMRRYEERLAATLPPLLPHLPADRRTARLPLGEKEEEMRIAALVVGSERGLCGRFNTAVVKRAESYLAEQEADGAQVEFMALGTRVCRFFQRREQPLAWSSALSVTALPHYRLAFDLTHGWLARYEKRELDAVDLVYNAYHGTGRYEPTVARLIPPTLPTPGPDTLPWPPPIIETNPLSLYARVVEQWAAVSLYGLLLESAAAVHSTRFQLMEAATQNAERLISELTLAVQTARQQAITQEMQELAVGAGLIGPR